MIWILVAGTALAVLLIVPAVPQAAHAAKARRGKRSGCERKTGNGARRRPRSASDRRSRSGTIPQISGYTVNTCGSRPRSGSPGSKPPTRRTASSARLTTRSPRHQSTFRDGKPPKAGYQLLAMAGLVAFAFVFILGAALDYLIFRASHPGNVLLPLGLACIAMIGITVGSILAFGARRHRPAARPHVPANPEHGEAVRHDARGRHRRVHGLHRAQSFLSGLGRPRSSPTSRRCSKRRTPWRQTPRQRRPIRRTKRPRRLSSPMTRPACGTRREIDRASALALGALEIPLAEAAVIGGELVIFRIPRRRRDRAERDYVEAVRAVARADATFMADSKHLAHRHREQRTGSRGRA